MPINYAGIIPIYTRNIENNIAAIEYGAITLKQNFARYQETNSVPNMPKKFQAATEIFIIINEVMISIQI